VRWTGLVRALGGGQDGVEEDIYSASLTAADERVRLWLGHALVIDQWNSLDSLVPSWGGGGAFTQATTTADRLLDLKVEYKKDAGGYAGGGIAMQDAGFRLSRRKQTITPSTSGSSVLPRAHLFAASPIATGAGGQGGAWQVLIEPNVACAERSLMRGSGLTIATAGMTGNSLFRARSRVLSRALPFPSTIFCISTSIANPRRTKRQHDA
jgi:hypothetical protein